MTALQILTMVALKVFQSNFRKRLADFRDTSTFGGFCTKVTSQKRSVPKFGWLLVVFGGVVWTLANVWFTIGNYLEYNSFTTVEVERQDKIPFPAVTVCNNQPVNCERLLLVIENCHEVRLQMYLFLKIILPTEKGLH